MLWNFIRKEVTEGLRTPEVWGLMIIFPIVLTLILANAFSLQFDTEVEFEPVDYGLVLEDNSYKQYLFEAIGEYTSIVLTESDEATALAKAENGESGGYIVLRENSIDFYDNDLGGSSTMVLRSFLEVFVDKYQLGNALHHLSEEGRLVSDEQVPFDDNDYVAITGLQGRNTGSSFDYFGVTMLTLIIGYVTLMTYGMFDAERRGATLQRLKASPVSPLKIFFGKMTGTFLVTVIQILIIMIFNILVYKVNYGNFLLTFVTMLCLAFLYMAIGAFIAMFLPNSSIANTAIMLIVQASVIFGGGYFNIQEGSPMYLFKKFSPIGLVNEAMTESIWGNRYSNVYLSMAINVGIGLVLLILAGYKFKNSEVLA